MARRRFYLKGPFDASIVEAVQFWGADLDGVVGNPSGPGAGPVRIETFNGPRDLQLGEGLAALPNGPAVITEGSWVVYHVGDPKVLAIYLDAVFRKSAYDVDVENWTVGPVPEPEPKPEALP